MFSLYYFPLSKFVMNFMKPYTPTTSKQLSLTEKQMKINPTSPTNVVKAISIVIYSDPKRLTPP